MDQPKVFVIMPFAKEFDDLWHLGIRETLVNLGCICDRADEISKPGFVVSQIQQQIIDADLVVAEMTGKNPNVFYEVGWAHALCKPTILCGTNDDDLSAFDTRGYRYVRHNGLAHILRDQLTRIVPEVLKLDARLPLGSEVLWAWPSSEYEPPVLEWRADPKKNAGKLQGDLFGGQSIATADNGEKVLKVHDTGKNWNHHQDWSIARLLHKSSGLKLGDEIIVTLMARTNKDASVQIIGDGSKMSAGSRVWARVFPTASGRLSSQLWKQIHLASAVTATEGGQDPAAGGATVYVRFRTTGDVWVREIAVYRKPGAARDCDERS